MGSLSIEHWVVVLVVMLLIFGPKRLAGVGQGLGESIRALKKALDPEPPGAPPPSPPKPPDVNG